MGISGISSVFIGVEYLNNLREENHLTAVTATATTVGAGMFMTGFIYASAGTGLVASGAWFVRIFARRLGRYWYWCCCRGSIIMVIQLQLYGNEEHSTKYW